MTYLFEDRRRELFGREADIFFLINRAQQRGLTAVVARPLMGKTWTLVEVARRLVEDNHCLVGYHESKASERSHLLYAVADLYTRWLSDSDLSAQARSQWERHKDKLIPRIGQAIGRLFEELSPTIGAPEKLGKLVRSAFDRLGRAQTDLLTGGMEIAPLDYEQARDLTTLVAKISGKRIVLVLDAWEKSPSVRFEHQTLEAFLSHLDEWNDVHVCLGIRQPELSLNDAEDGAFEKALDLEGRSPSAVCYELPPLHLDEPGEGERIVNYIQQHVLAARAVAGDDLLSMIDAFPGVIGRWMDPVNRHSMQNRTDLKSQAQDAQDYRYREFDRLSEQLSGDHCKFAGRLAFVPRLDADDWHVFERVLLEGMPEDVVDELIARRVLENEGYPTYGHDTRHEAARRWFIERRRNIIKREGEGVLQSLAGGIKEMDDRAFPYVAALAACSIPAEQIGIDNVSRCLIDAAWSLFGQEENILIGDFDLAYREAVKRNSSVAPLISVALINRAVSKREQGDTEGAVADYSAVIELPGAPANQIAMALNHRGAAKGRQEDIEGAIADFTKVIKLPGAPADEIAKALNHLGVTKGRHIG